LNENEDSDEVMTAILVWIAVVLDTLDRLGRPGVLANRADQSLGWSQRLMKIHDQRQNAAYCD
jgi:hypothetical protein